MAASGRSVSVPERVRQADRSRNVYAGVKEADFRAGGKTWQEWRAAGEDANSTLVEGPIFVDAEKGDFTPKDDAVAKRIGFVPFEWPR